MQLSAHSPRKQQMYSRLRLINIHNRLNYSERHPDCGHDERKKRQHFPALCSEQCCRARCVNKNKVSFILFETAAQRVKRIWASCCFVHPIFAANRSNFTSKSSPVYMNKLGDLPWAGEISSDTFLPTEQSRSRRLRLLTTVSRPLAHLILSSGERKKKSQFFLVFPLSFSTFKFGST